MTLFCELRDGVVERQPQRSLCHLATKLPHFPNFLGRQQNVQWKLNRWREKLPYAMHKLTIRSCPVVLVHGDQSMQEETAGLALRIPVGLYVSQKCEEEVTYFLYFKLSFIYLFVLFFLSGGDRIGL